MLFAGIGPLKIASITDAIALKMKTAVGCETVARRRTYRSFALWRSSFLNNTAANHEPRVLCPSTSIAICVVLGP